MNPREKDLVELEQRFWQSMVEKGPLVLRDFELRAMDVLFPTPDMADTSTWIRQDGEWRCVMHAESPVRGGSSH